MPLANLSEREREVVYRSLKATLAGPSFPDAEFHTIIGLTRPEFAAAMLGWPCVDDSQESVRLAINNSMVNLLGYPYDEPSAFRQLIGESYDELERVYKKWLCERPGGIDDWNGTEMRGLPYRQS